MSSNIIWDKGMKAITEAVYESSTLRVISVKNNELKEDAFNNFVKNHLGHPNTSMQTVLFSSNDVSIYTLKLTESVFKQT